MIWGRLEVMDLRSFELLTVGTAIIISFCRGDAVSTAGAKFNSEQSTVMANNIEPRPMGGFEG